MPYTFKTEPYGFQHKIWLESRAQKVWAYLMEMGCVDSETEYLSPLGWRSIANYDGGKVAQFHLNGKADFVQPTAYLKEPCAEFYHFNHSRGLDQVLSPRHRILALTHKNYLKANKVAESYKPDHHWVELTPEAVVKLDRKYANIQIETTFHLDDSAEGLGITEAQLRLQVAFNADGYLQKKMRVRTQDYLGIVRLKRERKKERLVKLLQDAGIFYRRNDYTQGTSAGYSVFSFVPPLASKTYKDFWGKVSYRDKQIIANECQHWDGSQRKAEAFTFGSVNVADLDFIQYCLASTGRRASIGKHMVHAVGSGRSTNVIQLNCQAKIAPSGDGNMYCFSVPSTYLIFRRNGCIFVSGNTGKSLILANNAAWLYLEGYIDGMVYMSRKGELPNFSTEELPKHMPAAVNYESYVYSTAESHRKSEQQVIKEFLVKKTGVLPILSINVETLYTSPPILATFYANFKRVFLAVDESTCIKNHKSRQSKHVYYWAARSTYRRIATGSPITQSPLDIYGQSLILGRNVLGFSSFYAFRGTFCEMEKQYLGNRSYNAIVGYKNLDMLTAKLKTFSHIILKADCLDLPPKVYVKKIVEFTPEQAKLYSDMRDKALIEFEGKQIEVVNVLSQIVKLHQISCGQLRLEDGSYLSIPNNKLKVLVELVEDYGKKVIIWAGYRQTIKDIVRTLKDKFGEDSTVAYYGGMSKEERSDALERFKRGNAQFFVGNQRTAGFGLTLTEAWLVIYFANTYPLIHRLQSEDRAHRIGQVNSVTYVDLFIPNTIDERIMTILRQRKNLADIVMERPLADWI